MILFPAIDLLAGKVVRLKRGDRAQVDVYSDDPVAVARDFADRAPLGARRGPVLGVSRGQGCRREEPPCHRAHLLLGSINVDTGGGVRDMEVVRRLADAGAKRIAIGTALVRDPDFAEAAARDFPDQVVADVAAHDGEVRVDGWREGEGLSSDDLVAHLSELGFRHLVFTDIARDGMQTGIDVAAYRHVAKVAGSPSWPRAASRASRTFARSRQRGQR